MKMKNMIAALSAVMVSAASFAAMSITASAETKDSYDFKLGFLFAGTNIDEHIQVTADGQYTITAAIPDAGETNKNCLTLFIDSDVNIYDYAMTDGGDGIKDGVLKLTVDSVVVDGTPVAYTQSPNAVTTGDDGTSLRCNIHNPYAKPEEILDIPSVLTGTDKIEVTFTVSGLFNAQEEPTDAPTEAPTDAPSAATTAAATTAAGATTAAATSAPTTSTASNASTGESNGIALVVAGLAVAGAAAVVTRKRK